MTSEEATVMEAKQAKALDELGITSLESVKN